MVIWEVKVIRSFSKLFMNLLRRDQKGPDISTYSSLTMIRMCTQRKHKRVW